MKDSQRSVPSAVLCCLRRTGTLQCSERWERTAPVFCHKRTFRLCWRLKVLHKLAVQLCCVSSTGPSVNRNHHLAFTLDESQKFKRKDVGETLTVTLCHFRFTSSAAKLQKSVTKTSSHQQRPERSPFTTLLQQGATLQSKSQRTE